MEIPKDSTYEPEFDTIECLRWYPFVGQRFRDSGNRALVFAHNIPVRKSDIENRKSQWSSKATWANAINEYTYSKRNYKRAFRSFVKAGSALTCNFDESSNPSTLKRVSNFLETISYVNFIQDIVVSEVQNALATPEQIEISKRIAVDLFEVLDVTHCICWGAHVTDYILSTEGTTDVKFSPLPRAGFGFGTFKTTTGRQVEILKVYHPGMPSFGCYSKQTQSLISSFMNRKILAQQGAAANP